MSEQLSLLEPQPDRARRARRTDPATSQSARNGGNCELEVLRVLGEHPAGLTDDELCEKLPDRYSPTVKSARSRLSRIDRLEVVGTGLTRPSRRGRDQIVWTLRTQEVRAS